MTERIFDRGIVVIVQGVDDIYDDLMKTSLKLNRRLLRKNEDLEESIPLSRTAIHSTLFSSELTSLNVEARDSSWYDDYPNGLVGFQLATKLYLSKHQRVASSMGFYSHARVQTILDGLSQKGYNSYFDICYDADPNAVGIDIIGKRDDVRVNAFFGYPSKSAEIIELREVLFPAENDLREKKKIQTFLSRGNTEISLTLESATKPGNTLVELTDLETFKEQIVFYAKVYEDLLSFLFRESGRKAPDTTVVFRRR